MFREIKPGIKKKSKGEKKKKKAGRIESMYDMRADRRHSISTSVATATIYRPR